MMGSCSQLLVHVGGCISGGYQEGTVIDERPRVV